MHRGKTPEEYIETLEQIEQLRVPDERFLSALYADADDALAAGDIDALLALIKRIDTPEGRDIRVRSIDLLDFRYILGAIALEREIGFPLFCKDVETVDALLDRYVETTLYLRRIEFSPLTEDDEAFSYIRTQNISPYLVSALIYSVTSLIGHREQVLLRLADDALAHERYREAYGFLSVIEQPGAEAQSLKSELEQALMGGGG